MLQCTYESEQQRDVGGLKVRGGLGHALEAVDLPTRLNMARLGAGVQLVEYVESVAKMARVDAQVDVQFL